MADIDLEAAFAVLEANGYAYMPLSTVRRTSSMETEIETLRAQLATSHALGFKAGIEAAAEVAASWRNPAAIKLAAGEMTAQELRTAQAVAGGIEMSISALPTPPSALPELLEAMRPAKKHAVELEQCSLFVDSEPLKRAMTDAAADLRTIDAAFTKLGGKIDAE